MSQMKEDIIAMKSKKFKVNSRRGTQPPRRTAIKKKPPILKFSVMMILTAASIAGAVYWGIEHNKTAKAEFIVKVVQERALNEAKAQDDEVSYRRWNNILKVYKPATKDVTLADKAIADLEKFISAKADPNRIVTAQHYITRLENLKRKHQASLVYKQKKLNNQIVEVINKLVKQAQSDINKKQYLEAFNIFAQYKGPLAEESKVGRQNHMDQLNSLAEKERQGIAAAKIVKEQEFLDSIAADIVHDKSIASLENADNTYITSINPGIIPLIKDYKNAASIVIDYFKANEGKVMSLTRGTKSFKTKIIKTERQQMQVIQIVHGKKFSTKIKYRNLFLGDKVRAIESVNPEAAALYGAVASLKKNDKRNFLLYSANTGPLASGLINTQ